MTKERAGETPRRERGETGEERGLARREAGMRSGPLAAPFALMRRFMEDLDRLVGGVGPDLMPRIDLGGFGEARETPWFPALDVFEREGNLVVRVDAPGLSKDQLRVDVEDGQLVISGERTQEHEEHRAGLYRCERSHGSFHRVVPLPEGVEPEQAKATFTNGVLEITMPAPRRAQAKRIEIREGPSGEAARKSEAKSA
jgi:HSP20 family protein